MTVSWLCGQKLGEGGKRGKVLQGFWLYSIGEVEVQVSPFHVNFDVLS